MGYLGALVLAVHLAVIAFNLFGLVAIPLGAWRGWAFVRVRWWRLLHVVSLAVVAAQALAGRACFLTLWQGELSGTGEEPLIMRFVNGVIYWPLPMWAFTAAYAAVFVYALALWKLVPPAVKT
ncbi:hypothetical protein ASE17_09935 [Phenylobacterium sp. Root77]|uniref:DUF2784 family protein n=1 Tax=unclassified Phenylobacterium TaxID=2640670 RepID=UPI0006F39FAA|nr:MULTISPECIES: DUF2784 family protein [unclassified Phenylobacterium]KQW73249.1 hypothetical protein ASC73_02505 [Phenylobacterium sp. Root1277]KQW92469.1 hypothetical protein ASC79_13215 [Phenylobacterium sp. Root1290]KRC40698.1 hypothetical protein ASE17_09935 [Phenylobacterium sp. Root77]